MTIKTMNESTYSKNALENSSGVVSSSFTVKRYLNIQLVFCRHLFWQPNHHGCVSQSRRPWRSNISFKRPCLLRSWYPKYFRQKNENLTFRIHCFNFSLNFKIYLKLNYNYSPLISPRRRTVRESSKGNFKICKKLKLFLSFSK